VIENSQDDSKRTFSKLLNNFITVANLFVVANDVFLLVVVKSIVCFFVDFAVGSAARVRLVPRVAVLFALGDREEVDGVKLEDLAALDLPEVRGQNAGRFFGVHGEAQVILALREHGGGLRVLADRTHLGGELRAIGSDEDFVGRLHTGSMLGVLTGRRRLERVVRISSTGSNLILDGRWVGATDVPR